ncbi:hypothetical protein M569_13811, partial [Genlisea aurea]
RSAHGGSLATRPSSYSRPFESNLRRILRIELQNLRDYTPPYQPDTKYERFRVEDRPGERWITLHGTSPYGEDIKIEASMFDGSMIVPRKSGDDESDEEEDIKLHISVVVDVRKPEGADFIEFVCSAWPDSLEILKVYVFPHDGLPPRPYIGPDIKRLSSELRIGFSSFLSRRGLNEGLSKFLHSYMMNKAGAELMNWLENVNKHFD